MIPLTMLLYELIVVRHSPELAAFNAIWVMAIIMLLQNPVKAYLNKEPIGPAFKQSVVQIFSALATGARNMCSVALATAAAGIIVGVVAMGLGGLITEVIDVLSGGNIFLLLVITAVASLIIGMGLPTTATYIVMASLTAPVIVEVGGYMDFIVPLMSAHLFCFYFGILADDTPAGRAGRLCRRGDCQIAADSHRFAGLHVRYPHGHTTLHVHFQQRFDSA